MTDDRIRRLHELLSSAWECVRRIPESEPVRREDAGLIAGCIAEALRLTQELWNEVEAEEGTNPRQTRLGDHA